MKNLSKDLVAASSIPIILSILAEREDYGYNIIKRVKEISKGNLEFADGTLYPVLRKLEDKGLIKSEWKTSEEGRKRRYYCIEQKGKITLKKEKENWSLINSIITRLWQPNASI